MTTKTEQSKSNQPSAEQTAKLAAAGKEAAGKEAAGKEAAGKEAAEDEAKVKAAQNGSFVPNENEKHLFHVKLEQPAYDSKTGKKLSKAFIQKFPVAEWNMFSRNAKNLGYTTEIMWNPEKYKD